MKSFVRETPAGPVLEILMQTPGLDCVLCGGEFDPADTTTQRVVYPDGVAGHRVICLGCVARCFGGREPPEIVV